MLEIIFLIALALVWIVFATVQDLKNREVANWLNFSLIIFVLGFRFFYSLFSENGFNFFYQGLIGLGIFFVIGNVLYYGRMFAGGDAKLMIALGAVLPLSERFYVNYKIFIWFLLIFLFSGAVYGSVISVVMALKNFKSFKREFSKQIKKNKKYVLVLLFFGLVFMIFGFFENLFFLTGAFVFIFPYIFLFARAVDNSCLVKTISTKKLREGDWLYGNVKIGRNVVKAKWEGLSREDIKRIQRKYRKIKIRQGVPFVPVFLISFLVLIGMNWLWNPLW
ncbi:MAG: prepilin peptidase [Nanoarchaeota archaeon]|nr:prepilin peptidase [Nanoarchaeota archaeon]